MTLRKVKMLNSRKHNIPVAQSKKSLQPIPDHEPVFLIRAQDETSVIALELIAEHLMEGDMYKSVMNVANDFRAWQEVYPELVKEPKP